MIEFLVDTNNIVDIKYDDFIKNPLMEIKKVYASLQMDMTIETENNIQQFLLMEKVNLNANIITL